MNANAGVSELDFLSIQASDSGIERTGRDLYAPHPWSLMRMNGLQLRPGWWRLECKSEDATPDLEVRLTSPGDPLIVFRGAASANDRILLRASHPYDVSLLLSPWPERQKFDRLRLKKLSLLEEADFLLSAARRVLGGKQRLMRLARILRAFRAGRSFGVRTEEPAPQTSAPPSRVVAGASADLAFRAVREGDLVAILRAGDTLHTAAFEIARKTFAASPGLKAIYADRREGDRIVPRPQWDAELARHIPLADSPIFLPAGIEQAPEPGDTLNAIVARHGAAAVARLALPLADRPSPPMRVLPEVAVPRLERTPRVSLVIPTKDRVDLLEKCLNGLMDATGYPDIEVVIVDNGCTDPRMPAMVDALRAHMKIVTVLDTAPFNFPRLCNGGVRQSSGEIVVLLNDDAEPVQAGWLHRMVESALSHNVGAVGARLLYPDGTIQHAGVILGISGTCGHMWKGLSPADAAQNPYVVLPGGRMAVTGACLAVRRDLYDKVGGLDEEAFPVAYNDIDFCLRLREAGYATVYRGDAVLVHHESQSRGLDDVSAEKQRRLSTEMERFLLRWRLTVRDDPFGSPAFDPLREDGAVLPSLLRR